MFIDPLTSYTPPITPTQSIFVKDQLYFGSFNEGTVHRITLKGENFDVVAEDKVVYQGKPWGIVGIFYGSDNHSYVTQPTGIERFVPED